MPNLYSKSVNQSVYFINLNYNYNQDSTFTSLWYSYNGNYTMKLYLLKILNRDTKKATFSALKLTAIKTALRQMVRKDWPMPWFCSVTKIRLHSKLASFLINLYYLLTAYDDNTMMQYDAEVTVILLRYMWQYGCDWCYSDEETELRKVVIRIWQYALIVVYLLYLSIHLFIYLFFQRHPETGVDHYSPFSSFSSH